LVGLLETKATNISGDSVRFAIVSVTNRSKNMNPLIAILGMSLSDFGVFLGLIPISERINHAPLLIPIVASSNLNEIKPRLPKRSVPQGFL
jgi:hypothetical protein